MFERFKNIKINTESFYVIGISIFDEISQFNLIQVKLENNDLTIVNRVKYAGFNSCLEKLDKDYPIILHFEGDDIINKLTDNIKGYRKEIIFNANPDDFYFYELHQTDKICSSVIRKSHVDNYLSQLNSKDKFVVYITVGPFVLCNLSQIFKNNNTISSDRYQVNIDRQEIIAFNTKPYKVETLKVNEDSYINSELPLIASVLDYKFPNQFLQFDTSFLNFNRSQYLFKKRFKIAGYTALLVLMVLLFISHSLQKIYLEDLLQKDAMYNLSVQTANELEQVKKDLQLKEMIFEKSGINNSNFITKYFADITNTVDNNIILKTIVVIPPINKTRPNEEVVFNNNTIKVIGEALKDDIFNSWFAQLKTFDWVKKIDILDYSQGMQNRNMFTLEIKI